MRVDPRFSLSIERLPGGAALRFSAARELEIEEDACLLARAEFDELAELAELPEGAASALREPRRRSLFSNGWQSWSFAGELSGREAPRRAFPLPSLNLYTDRPGPLAGRGEILSHFYTYLRAGDWRLILLSRGLGPAAPAGPPISFRIDRGSLSVGFEALAGGASFRAGEPLAEIRILAREGFFPLRDALREAFAEYDAFRRLDFLFPEASLPPGGYESWYNHYLRIDEGLLRADLAEIRREGGPIEALYLRRGRPAIFQVDDGWERGVGDWEAAAGKFPSGMDGLAREIEASGLIPGLWLAPLAVSERSAAFREKAGRLLKDRRGRPLRAGWNPGWGGNFYVLDLSLPEVEDYLRGLFDRIVEDWGYRYLKLDFLYAGLLRGAFARGGAAYRHYDRVMGGIASRLEDSRGRPLAWLGCGAPLEPSFRHFPLMRVGADTREAWEWPALRLIGHEGRPAAAVNLRGSLERSLLDGAVFRNDPDVIFCRSRGMGYGDREKELIALAARLLGSQLMVSDGAGDFGDPAARAFVAGLLRTLEGLPGGEWGAERIEAGLYRVLHRGGACLGFVNLRETEARLGDAGPERLPEAGAALAGRPRSLGGRLVLDPRSILLFKT